MQLQESREEEEEIVRKILPQKQSVIPRYVLSQCKTDSFSNASNSKPKKFTQTVLVLSHDKSSPLSIARRKGDVHNCNVLPFKDIGNSNYKCIKNKMPKYSIKPSTSNNDQNINKRISQCIHHESTPLRKKKKNEDSDALKKLIYDITPVKDIVNNEVNCKSAQNTKSLYILKPCVGSNNASVQSPIQNKMLSLDESVLNAFDFECIEKNYMDDNTSKIRESKSGLLSPDIFLGDNDQKSDNIDMCTPPCNNEDAASSVCQSENNRKSSSKKCAKILFQKKSCLSSQRCSQKFKTPNSCHNKSKLSHSQIAQNDFNQHWEDLRGIDIDWINDSMVANAMKDTENNTLNSPVIDFMPVGERLRRTLVTNAQNPVINVSKTKEDSQAEQLNTSTNGSYFDLGPFFGLPSRVKGLIQQCKGIGNLYAWQEECLNLKAIKERTNLVYALPTSGGKTLVAEILILRELLCYKKNAIFVLPYVSIVQEKIHSLSPFAVELNFLVEEYAAGKGQYPPKKRRRKQSVYVATIEKALGVVNSLIETNRLSELGLVIVDELHLVGETNGRGATLEGLLTKLLFCPENIHIVGMSATIGNLNEIAMFLHAEIYTQDFRPVELKEYIKCDDSMWAINWEAQSDEDAFTIVRKLAYPYTPSMAKIDPDRLGGLVLEIVPDNSCLVFCPSKKNAENVAQLICKVMPREMLEHKKEERAALYRALTSDGNGSICPILKKCLPYGVVYHHSGLTMDERRLLEEAYSTGTLCCICCTSTLAAGVNLPAKRVILRSPYVARDFINLSRYKQMVGRAGRAGKGDSGESILICKSSEINKVSQLLRSKMDDATSSMHQANGKGIRALVLSAVGLNLANNRIALHNMAQHTLMAVQSGHLEINVKKIIDEAIVNLFKMKALKILTEKKQSSLDNSIPVNDHVDISVNISSSSAGTDLPNSPQPRRMMSPRVVPRSGKKSVRLHNDTQFTISRLGKAAMKGPIDLGRAHLLYKDLLQAQACLVLLSCLHLLYLITPYELMGQIKPVSSVYFHVYNELDIKDMQTARILGLNEGAMLRIMKGNRVKSVPEHVIHRFYLTLMLNELWNQKSVWHVADKYRVPRGTVQTLMTSASSFASCVMRFCEELEEFWAFKELLASFTQRLSHCCKLELLPLMDLPAVKIGRARQLYNAGYKTLKDIATAESQSLVRDVDHMPKKVASRIIAAAKLLLLEKVESLQEEAEDVMEGLATKSSNNQQFK